MTFDFNPTAIVVTFFGSLIMLLVGVIGALSRSSIKDLIAKVEQTRAEAERAAKANADRDARMLDLTERQNVEIAKLGVGLLGLDHRVTDVDRNLRQLLTEQEQRIHRLATQLQNVFLGLNIKLRRGDMPDDGGPGGTGAGG